MDNNERREDMIPITDSGQQINLVVNQPDNDNVIEINIARVFHSMKLKLRIYAWVMVLCFMIGVCAPLLLYQFSKKPLAVSSVVTLKYDVVQKSEDGKTITREPVQDLSAPDDTELDLAQVTSSYVLQAALEGLKLSSPLSLADLRDNITIDRLA